ncbi:MAG: DUF2283 domain-containing protein [Candidatus Aenigmarchaeota archaeon]|nr:DUF2283 domain-containing protein [Candidatus Aenigmarchaeota archaeon]
MEKMRFFYDDEGDVLDISIGKPRKAKSEEIGNDIIVRKDKRGKVVGFTILNFEKRSEKEKGFNIPVEAKFETA